MSTNLSDQTLPFIPRHVPSAPRTPVDPGAAYSDLWQNAVSLVGCVAMTAIVLYLVFRM